MSSPKPAMVRMRHLRTPVGRLVNTKSAANTEQSRSHKKTTEQPQEDEEGTTTPTGFMSLPIEIRKRIWEATWPKPRVIGHCRAWTGIGAERRTTHYLRAVGSIKDYSHLDYYWILGHAIIEPCPDPMALQICRESREHTQSTYIPMVNSTFRFGSFYFDPQRDTLLLCWDFDECMPDLVLSYGVQLRKFEKVLVDGHFWAKEFSALYEDVLRAFKPATPQPQWLFGALYEIWGIDLDPCGVRAAVKFVSKILERTELFQQAYDLQILRGSTEELAVAEDFGKIVVAGGGEGGDEKSLGVTGNEISLYIYLNFLPLSEENGTRVDAFYLCECPRHPTEE